MRVLARNLITVVALSVASTLCSAGMADEGYRLVAHENTVLTEEVARLQGEVARMDELRVQVAALQQKLDASMTGAPAPAAAAPGCGDSCCGSSCCGSSCGNCCSCCCDPCCRSEGWVGGAEWLWLKPHDTNGTGFSLFNQGGRTQAVDSTLDPDFESSYRLWVGYQMCDGLGFRVRYWEFDHSATAVLAAGAQPNVFQGWDVWTLDVETTVSSRLGCNWDATASAGFRYVDFFSNRGVNDGLIDNVVSSSGITGYGLTGSVELRRQVSCNLLGFGNARASVIMGDETNVSFFNDGVNPPVTVTEIQRNDVKFIYEAQMGADYVMPMCGGGYYYVRGGVEVQYWDNAAPDTAFGPLSLAINGSGTGHDNGSTAFAGFFFGAGIAR